MPCRRPAFYIRMVNRKRRPRGTVDGTTTTGVQGQAASNTGGGSAAGSGPSPAKTPAIASQADSGARLSQGASYTTAGVVGLLYDELITWAIREVAIRYRHRLAVTRIRNRLATVPTSGARDRDREREANSQHPELHYSDKNVTATCTNCRSTVSASRYAQHLEKCLGRGGRVSSRAASARLKASAEREERENSEDAAAISTGFPQRRRRASQHDTEPGPKASKRRRPSPAPVPASASSGRNR